jgi:RNA polymerase sigma factor (sigma-70 family)
VREWERFALATVNRGHAAVHAHSLYRDHHPWLQGLLRKRVGNRDDAADLAHDIFVRIMGSALRADEIREPQRYLATMARGMVADFFRRRSLEQAYMEYLAAQPGDLAPSAEAQVIVQQTLVAVDRMLLGLPDKVRQAFLLAQFGDMNYPEIAGQLGISVRTVSNYLTRALEHCCLGSA